MNGGMILRGREGEGGSQKYYIVVSFATKYEAHTYKNLQTRIFLFFVF